MKATFGPTIAICSALSSMLVAPMGAAQAQSPRMELAADSKWKFLLGDPPGAEAALFQDASWRMVNLPHDWSIESPPDKSNATGAGGGFFPAGTGWYRKTFRPCKSILRRLSPASLPVRVREIFAPA